MAYTTDQKNAAAYLLCSYFPRLHFGVARAWVTAEAGDNFNVFGVKVRGVLRKYPSMAAGVDDAVRLLRASSNYARVVAAFEAQHSPRWGCPAFGSHASAQASALVHSPWHSGVIGLRAQGGVDAYYARIFGGRGYNVLTDDERMRLEVRD